MYAIRSYYGPTFRLCLIEGLVQLADMRFSIIRPLPLCICMVNEKAKAGPRPSSRPFQHLQIAVGIAEGCDRAATDVRVDTDRLPFLVIDKVNFRESYNFV